MGFPYRCAKCFARHSLSRRLEDYVRPKKCKACGHTTLYFDKDRWHRQDYCSCAGLHYTHRIKSRFCIHHPDYEFDVRTKRYGEDPVDVRIEQALKADPQPQEDETCPF